MDLAEETGFIVPMGEWALHAACRAAHRWQSAGVAMTVAVNLSARQFHHGELVATLAGVLAATNLPARWLEIEITESMVMRNPTHAASVMQAIRAMGIRITLDDFGTGYSSLGYLKRFPIDCLKLDRSFVADLPHDINDVAITRAVIAMAHTLSIGVIAEGVENEEQLQLLRSEGCDEYQAYLCQPALEEPELIRFLRARAATHRRAVEPAAPRDALAWPRGMRA
jgi:EAL domain-containing protein (putative c-di-GMP-specific phosphodiesterase class I)